MTWYFHPWRTATFLIGLMGLLVGADFEQVADWNYEVSIVMAGATYLLMPLFDQELRKGNWLFAFLIGDFCVNTTYTLYWSIMGNPLADAWNNYWASWTLFLLCWAIWCLPYKPFPQPLIALCHLLQRGRGT